MKNLQAELNIDSHSIFAICGNNSMEWVELFFAMCYRGCICIPLDITLHSEGMKYILETSEPTILFTTKKLLIEKISSIIESKEASTIKTIVIFDDHLSNLFDKDEIPDNISKPILYTKHLLPNIESEGEIELNDVLNVEKGDQIPLLIVHTSGSTGVPKGVPLTQGYCLDSIQKV